MAAREPQTPEPKSNAASAAGSARLAAGPRSAEPPQAQRGPEPLDALRHRDFRIFWIGALISNTGTWLHGASVAYVLFQMTDSNTWVGMSLFVSLFPGVVCAPIAGTIADRLDRRRMLLVIQVISLLVAVAFAVMWASGVRSPGVILGVGAVSGIIMGFGMPSWQGLLADLVPRELLSAAVTMNSIQFHGSRAIGPAIAGVILSTVGPTWAFIGNAVSYLAIIAALLVVTLRPSAGAAPSRGVVRDLVAGLRYARSHNGIATALVLVIAVGFLGNPIVQLAPAFSERVYKVDADSYGMLTAAFGLGAAIGIYLVGRLAQRFSRAGLLLRGLIVLGVAVLGFGASSIYAAGLVCVLVAGSAAVGLGVLLLTTVQMKVADEFRGRVLGVYAMAFTASYPLGALAQGRLADAVGPRSNELIVGTVILLLVGWLISRRHLLATLEPPSRSGSGAHSLSES